MCSLSLSLSLSLTHSLTHSLTLTHTCTHTYAHTPEPNIWDAQVAYMANTYLISELNTFNWNKQQTRSIKTHTHTHTHTQQFLHFHHVSSYNHSDKKWFMKTTWFCHIYTANRRRIPRHWHTTHSSLQIVPLVIISSIIRGANWKPVKLPSYTNTINACHDNILTTCKIFEVF